ncbi:TetR/AcrR family transcriptional regulator [Bacillus licheniformis]|nr:TetR/AcrR family transcriptional regulator [Bacillus licheniformis]
MNEKSSSLKGRQKLFAQKAITMLQCKRSLKNANVKASIYKLFQSKEDLLLALIKFRKHEMLNKSAVINTETSLTPKERFAKNRFGDYGIQGNRQFINFISNEGSSPDTAVFKSI